MLAAIKAKLSREPQPRPIVLANDEILARYEKLVEEAKVIPSVVSMAERRMRAMSKAVKDAGLGYYDLRQVERYLNKIKPLYTEIVWRAATVDTAKQFHSYKRLIPADAVEVIKRVSEGCPDKLHFFVSDYEQIDPDPFLAICLASEGRGAMDPRQVESFRVIYHWDEPGFGKI